MALKKIVSGGQTGVDRAALDYALGHSLQAGGFCPKGRLAEDGRIPNRYPLLETDSAEYQQRTVLNVLTSDGTLIIMPQDRPQDGTANTIDAALDHSKPLCVICLNRDFRKDSVLSWIENFNIQTLNVAGPRASEAEGIYDRTMEVLSALDLGTTTSADA